MTVGEFSALVFAFLFMIFGWAISIAFVFAYYAIASYIWEAI